MRLIRNLGWMAAMAIGIGGCFKAPEFPIIPSIEFNNIEFTDVKDPSVDDTLKLTLNFKDGDGDLGLDPSETDAPYNEKWYYRFSDGTFITYKTKRTDPRYDTLPDFVTPYNCTNWEVTTDPTSGVVLDTLYFQFNPTHYNIFVQFYVQQPDGTFKLFDWANEFIYPNCNVGGFNGRFPILSKDLSQKAAQEGKIQYSMRSVGFNYFFSIKFIKLKVEIMDRALHLSDTVETKAFQLKAI